MLFNCITLKDKEIYTKIIHPDKYPVMYKKLIKYFAISLINLLEAYMINIKKAFNIFILAVFLAKSLIGGSLSQIKLKIDSIILK